MSELVRRIRGMVGLGIMWSALWGTIFAVLGLIAWVVDPSTLGPGEGATVIVGTGLLLGLVSGAVFSGLLLVLERGKRISELSPLRVGLLGAVATAVFPLLTPADPSMLVMLCPIGAGIAGGSVAMAKRASPAPGEPKETFGVPPGPAVGRAP